MIENDNHDGCDWYFGVPFPSKRKAAEMAGRKFKVGDRVRVVDARGGGNVGDIGVITRVDPVGGQIYYDISGIDGVECLMERRLEPAPHFPRGARVRLTRNHGVYKKGHAGTVTVENDENVGVLMDIGRYAAFPHDVLDVDEGKQHAPADAPAPWSAPDRAGRKVEREFKRGDDVRALHDCENGGYYVGDVFTVQRVFVNSFVFIDNDGDSRLRGTDEFELVTPAPCPQDNEQVNVLKIKVDTSGLDAAIVKMSALAGPCIVALVNKDGKPRPSQWPHVHPDSSSATAEAERLARNNPGTEFAVYQRVAGRKAEVHVEMREVA